MPARLVRLLVPVLLLLGVYQLGGAGVVHAKAWLAPLLIERAWLQSRAAGRAGFKPWPWADTWPVARLRVASVQVDQFVLAGDSGNALAFSPGHSSASAPLGAPGRAVIGGHRDTHFAFLDQLQPGDSLSLELPDGTMRRYRVSDLSVVDTSREQLEADPLADELLLVTCYPFDAIDNRGPLRYVVTATQNAQKSGTDPNFYRFKLGSVPDFPYGGFSL